MTMKLTDASLNAYKTANPNSEAAEASKHAKKTEEQARQNALSIKEYHELCAKAVQLLLNSGDNGPVEDHHVDEHKYSNLPSSGAHIGRYRNAQHHRDGRFSEVFKAIDPTPPSDGHSPLLVALKTTMPAMMEPPHDSKREARILSTIKNLNIIPLLETFQEAGGGFVLVFPFMQFGLDGLLRNKQLTPVSRKIILRDLFLGLAHLHSLDIIHRDVKPSNILLASPNGPACLADFGIAWSPTDPASEPADNKFLDVGTTCYRPPELLFGHQAYGTELDMWSAGCVAAQVVSLNGETLFDAGDLGSELALIKSIFEALGTPDLDVWPEAARLPDWGKMNFTRYPGKRWEDILPGAEPAAADLVSKLVVFESGDRLCAQEALQHHYLQQ